MSWPPPQYNAQPEPPERQYTGYPEQSAQSYGYPQNSPGYPTNNEPSPGYPPSTGQPYPGYGGEQPAQSYGYPQGSPSYSQDPGPSSPYQQQGGQSYPGYAQNSPGYSQDGQSNSGFQQPPMAPKKSKAGKIVLIALAAVLVLCGGAGAAVYFIAGKDAVEAAETRVVAPETLVGRPKISNPDLKGVIDEALTSMKQDVPGAKDVVGGFYGDPEKEDLVMVVAVSGLIADPSKELDKAIKGADATLKVADVKEVDPGPLGGEAKCGNATARELKVAVCFWADNGSMGMVAIYFAQADDKTAAEFVTIRGEVEQKS